MALCRACHVSLRRADARWLFTGVGHPALPTNSRGTSSIEAWPSHGIKRRRNLLVDNAGATCSASPVFVRRQQSPVGTCHPSDSRRWASTTGTDFEKQLMPEDILHLRATSMAIMQDPICEVRPEEAQQYVVQHPDPMAELPVWHLRKLAANVTQPFRNRKLVIARYNDLIIERLDNEPLLGTFGIDTGFNMQTYFMILHAWLLHQRLVLEGTKAKKLDEDLFEACWTLIRNWMVFKKIPEYRFDAELQNVQEYMLGCCVHMDKALEQPDILPARVQQVLWANIYSGSVKKDAAALTRLTKYMLRQLGLMLQLEADCFLNGNFVWADFPLPDEKPKPLQLPIWRSEFNRALKETKEVQ